MAISYRIIQEHGGKIDVESHEGAGTTITVTLPTHRAPAAATELHAHSGSVAV
jgi:signal transduction histidine kinase